MSLCKRRGFIFPSAEIYGGLNGVYDYGYLGAELKKNLKQAWWHQMLFSDLDIFSFDAAVLTPKKVLQASGHLGAGFEDKLVECKSCHKRFKADEVQGSKCPECGGELAEPKNFNLMMKVPIGVTGDTASMAYLRPETCQGIFVNFKNIVSTLRAKIPFGVAQVGKSFRNEINPKNFVFRTREFEQMEMEWFCEPIQSDKWFDYWLEKRLSWYYKLGIKKDNLRVQEVPKEERAHYAIRQVDIEYSFPFGWKEIEGVHNRGDWDLSNHSKFSGENLKYLAPEGDREFSPYVIETSVGVERALFAFLCEAFTQVEGGRTKTTESNKEVEFLLRLHKSLAPVKVLVLPLVRNKPEVVKKAKEVYKLLKPHFLCQYDEKGSIGRRYRRGDEIGVPFSITIDFDTLKRDDVTIRDRDTMKQERIKIKNLLALLNKYLKGTINDK